MEITLKVDICMICGKKLLYGNRIRAHLIPRSLKPKINVFAHFHKECEHELNKLYVAQQKKPEHERAKKRMMNILKDSKIKIKAIEKKIMEN